MNGSIHPHAEDVMAAIDGLLATTSMARVEAHLATCNECQALAQDFRDVRASVGSWRVELAPSRIAENIRQALPAEMKTTAPRRAAGFGRGGWLAVAAAIAMLILLATDVVRCGAVWCARPQPSAAAVAVPATPGATATATFERWWLAQPRVDLGDSSKAAPVVIVWFVDYECPACAANDGVYGPLFDRIVAANFGAVKLYVRDFPWNVACNPSIDQSFRGHEASCAAAVAMHLAAEHGKAPALKAWLFAHQGSVSIADIRNAAAEIAGVQDFDARYPSVIAVVRAELEKLRPAGVNVTPSCYINGVRAMDKTGRVLPPEDIIKAVDIELKQARSRGLR